MLRKRLHLFLCAVFVVFLVNAPNVFGDTDISRIIKTVKKSVVSIYVDPDGLGYSELGSGFIACAKELNDQYIYYVFSNKHVGCSTTKRFMAQFENEYKKFRLNFVGEAKDRDFSVWKFSRKKSDGYKLPTISLGDSSKMRSGDEVYAIGYPMGYGFITTRGTIAKNPFFLSDSALGINDIYPFIMSDININPGNSGGVLVNKYGKWVGITSLMIKVSLGHDQYSAKSGLGLAIPSNSCWRMFQDIMKFGRVQRAVIGIVIDPPVIRGMFSFAKVREALVAMEVDALTNKIDLLSPEKRMGGNGRCPKSGAGQMPPRHGPDHGGPMIRSNRTSKFKTFIDNMPEDLRAWIINIDETYGERFEYAKSGMGMVVLNADKASDLKSYDIIWKVNSEEIMNFGDYDIAVKLSDCKMIMDISRLNGSQVEDLTVEVPYTLGACVRQVVDTSPFYGKLQPGDVIEYYNGVRINTLKDLLRQVFQNRPGDSVELKIFRSGVRMSVFGNLGTPQIFAPMEKAVLEMRK